jgi:hypothetical protein
VKLSALFVSATLILLAQYAAASEVNVIDDIVYSGPSGRIIYYVTYVDGQEMTKSIKFVTSSGYVASALIASNGMSANFTTPDTQIFVSKLSSTQMRVWDVPSGESTIINRPSGGWPDISSLNLPAPQGDWALELMDLKEAYESYINGNGETIFSNPLRKYKDLGFQIEGTPSQCPSSCGLQTFWAVGLTLGIVAECAAIETGVAVYACAMSWAAWPQLVGSAITACTCTPVEEPPVNTDPATPPPAGTGCELGCSNYPDPGSVGGGSVRYGCIRVVTTKVSIEDENGNLWISEQPVCAEYGILP